MKTRLLLIVTLALVVSASALADRKTVTLKNGRKITGELRATRDGYEIKADGFTVVIAKSQVLRIDDAVSPAEELKRRLKQADSKDPNALFQVAAWARENGMFKESKSLLEQVLKLKPDHENARLTLKLVEISLSGSGSTKPPGPPSQGENPPPPDQLDPSMFLTTDDIYRIRLLELGDERAERSVSIQFRNDVINRFMKWMQGQGVLKGRKGREKFLAWNRFQKASYIIRETDREDTKFRNDILIKTDPAKMKAFRSRVWPVLRKGCATPSCHGGAKGAGKLKLLDMPVTDERVLYTNFYILHAWENRGRRLIDREDPAASMILRAGLPEGAVPARFAHPKPLKPPVYKTDKRKTDGSFQDSTYKDVYEWIASLRRPFLPPGYRVKYKLPGLQRGAEGSKPPRRNR